MELKDIDYLETRILYVQIRRDAESTKAYFIYTHFYPSSHTQGSVPFVLPPI